MDPNATLKLINDYLDAGDFDGASYARTDLINWLRKGGFHPDWDQYPEASRYVREALERTSGSSTTFDDPITDEVFRALNETLRQYFLQHGRTPQCWMSIGHALSYMLAHMTISSMCAAGNIPPEKAAKLTEDLARCLAERRAQWLREFADRMESEQQDED